MPNMIDAHWLDYTRLRNWYHDLPHNAPPTERAALREAMERAYTAYLAAEEAEERRKVHRNTQ